MLRHRTRTILKAAAVGALLLALPLGSGLIYQIKNTKQLREKLNQYESKETTYHYQSVYLLTKDLKAGDQITASDIEKKEMISEHTQLLTSYTSTDYVGTYAKIHLKKGCVLQPDFCVTLEYPADDERQLEIKNVTLPSNVSTKDFVDIRISFPNGEDYVVLKKKKIYGLLEEEEQVCGIRLSVNEQELMRYQAASVDTESYLDTILYAVPYVGEYQPAAQEYYPVNEAVYTLMHWNPNIRDLFLVEDEVEKRKQLEAHLVRFLVEENVVEAEEESTNEMNAWMDELQNYTELPQIQTEE